MSFSNQADCDQGQIESSLFSIKLNRIVRNTFRE